MTASVDIAAANERISRAISAAMAARGVKDRKQLAAVTGIKYDTLLRRLDGKPWLASEILAIAEALDVDPRALLEADPEQWFRREDSGSSLLPVTTQRASSKRGPRKGEFGLEMLQKRGMMAANAAA